MAKTKKEVLTEIFNSDYQGLLDGTFEEKKEMKIITNTKVIESEMIFDGDAYKVWEYTNDNKEQEIAIMDSNGDDVSKMSAVLDHGDVLNQVDLYCPDPEEYIHEQFVKFKP